VETLPIEDQMAEEMILGLRMTKGVSKNNFYKRYGCSMEEVYGDIIEKYKQDGLLTEEEGSLRFTKRGFDLSNIVLCEFV
jgi:oxygen-independent coproporphyrinogen-3 oxidase